MKGSFWGCKKQVIIHLKHSYQSSTLTVFCFFFIPEDHMKKKKESSRAVPYRGNDSSGFSVQQVLTGTKTGGWSGHGGCRLSQRVNKKVPNLKLHG